MRGWMEEEWEEEEKEWEERDIECEEEEDGPCY